MSMLMPGVGSLRGDREPPDVAPLHIIAPLHAGGVSPSVCVLGEFLKLFG